MKQSSYSIVLNNRNLIQGAASIVKKDVKSKVVACDGWLTAKILNSNHSGEFDAKSWWNVEKEHKSTWIVASNLAATLHFTSFFHNGLLWIRLIYIDSWPF